MKRLLLPLALFLSACTGHGAVASTPPEPGQHPQAPVDAPTFQVLTTPNAKQQRALELIRQIQL